MRSGLQWAGHIERMVDDRLPKRAAELSEEDRRRRGRPRLRLEYWVNRNLKKAGEGGRLKEEDKRQRVEKTIR